MKNVISTAILMAVLSVPAAVLAQGSMGHTRITKERITDRDGILRTTEVLKSGKRLETVTCRDFNRLDESFKPEAVHYAANYGPYGRAHPTETVSGVEQFVPVVITRCQSRPGDHLVSQVHTAMKTKKR